MMLTIKEVAKELKISLSLAYRLVASGELACYEIASCKRVDERQLKDYLERQQRARVKPPTQSKQHF